MNWTPLPPGWAIYCIDGNSDDGPPWYDAIAYRIVDDKLLVMTGHGEVQQMGPKTLQLAPADVWKDQ